MSQYSFGNLESPLSGEDLINTHLEPWRDALHSTHSGSSRPSYVTGGMIWLNTSSSPWILNIFDGAQDIPLFTIDTTANTASPSGITISSFIQTLLDDANATAARATLGVVIGADVQAYSSILGLLAGLTGAANKGIYFTGAGSMATFDLTAAGRALLDDADIAAQLATLGIGTAGLLNVGTGANQVVQLDGSGYLPALDGRNLINVGEGETIYDGAFTGGATFQDFTWTAGLYRKVTIELIDFAFASTASVNGTGYMRFYNNGTLASGSNNYHHWHQLLTSTTQAYQYDQMSDTTAATLIRISQDQGLLGNSGTGYSGYFEINNCLAIPIMHGQYQNGQSPTEIWKMDAQRTAAMSLFSGIRIGIVTSSSTRNIATSSKVRIKGYR